MPLPSPRSGETQAQFISRCMSNDTAKKDFPDQKQRTAVCFNKWKEARGETMKDNSKEKRDEKGRLIIAENVPIVLNATIGLKE